MKNFAKLQEALMDCHLLHGSPKRIKGALEPRKAHDEAKEGGNKVAIYSTSNPVIAIWKAVAHQERKNRRWMVGWSWNDYGEKVLYGKNIKLKKGYVYILPAEFFIPVPGDVSDNVSAREVHPAAKVKVSPKDLFELQKEMEFTIEIDPTIARLEQI